MRFHRWGRKMARREAAFRSDRCLLALASLSVPQAVGLGDYGHTVLGDGEAAAAVEIVIVADFDSRRDLQPLLDNRTADLGVPADLNPLEQNRFVDPCETVDPCLGAEDGPLHVAAGDNRGR